MFRMKGCKWDFIDIKIVMQSDILFFPVNPSSWIITLKRGKSSFGPRKFLEEENPVFAEDVGYRRLFMGEF